MDFSCSCLIFSSLIHVPLHLLSCSGIEARRSTFSGYLYGGSSERYPWASRWQTRPVSPANAFVKKRKTRRRISKKAEPWHVTMRDDVCLASLCGHLWSWQGGCTGTAEEKGSEDWSYDPSVHQSSSILFNHLQSHFFRVFSTCSRVFLDNLFDLFTLSWSTSSLAQLLHFSRLNVIGNAPHRGEARDLRICARRFHHQKTNTGELWQNLTNQLSPWSPLEVTAFHKLRDTIVGASEWCPSSRWRWSFRVLQCLDPTFRPSDIEWGSRFWMIWFSAGGSFGGLDFFGGKKSIRLFFYMYTVIFWTFVEWLTVWVCSGMFGYLDDSMFEKVGNFYDTFIIFGTCIHGMMSASCCN